MDQAPCDDNQVRREMRESLIRSATSLARRGQAVNLGVCGRPKVDDAKTQTNQFVF